MTEATRDEILSHMRESGVEFDPSGAGTGLPSPQMTKIWKDRLSRKQINEIEGVAGDIRKKLGYPSIE